MQSIKRSGVHTCCPQTMWNLAPSNTKQSPCLFSNLLWCPEERHSISHQIGSTSCAVQQSPSSWRRRSYDWLWLCQTNSWGQLGCVFCSSKSSLNFWASLLQYTQLVDQHAHHHSKTPKFESQNFFGQLKHIILLELPSSQWLELDEPTMAIIALIQEFKATLRNSIYYYKNFGVDEVVYLHMLQCVVGRIWDRDKWAIIDQSNIVDIEGD